MKYTFFAIGILIIIGCIAKHYKWFRSRSQSESTDVEINKGQSPLDDAKLKECLDMNNMWIGNSDQKAGMLLATIGIAFTILLTSDALIGIRKFIALPFIQYWSGDENIGFSFSRFTVFCYLLFTSITAVIALYYLLNTIRPNIDYKSIYKNNPEMVQKSYIYYGSVAKMTYAHFKNDSFNYTEDLRSQVFTNAWIAYTKFQNYLEGFFWFKMMMISAVLLFISIMLMQ